MRDDGAAEGVDPVVAEGPEVPAVPPRRLVPDLEGDVGEVRIGVPLDSEGFPGGEDGVAGRGEDCLLDDGGMSGFLSKGGAQEREEREEKEEGKMG